MATLVYGMMQSLDGYVAGPPGGPGLPMPGEKLHRYFNERMRAITGSLYGRRMYEVMQYWDEDQPGQDDVGNDFAAAWRSKPKWVVSRTLTSVGPKATLVKGDLETVVRALKAEQPGVMEVAGPMLAAALDALGLIDEYQIYIQPVVLGAGKPFFSGPRPPLRLADSQQVDGDTVRLCYVPA
jgi:dihydrofolate reductase